MSNLCVLKLSEMATLPTKGSDFAAAFDLYSAHNASIPPFSNALIQTDLSPSFPDGCYGRIAGRSGLALYNKIIVGGGVFLTLKGGTRVLEVQIIRFIHTLFIAYSMSYLHYTYNHPFIHLFQKIMKPKLNIQIEVIWIY